MDNKENKNNDIIDEDLYEDLDEEELYELVQEARQKAIEKEKAEKQKPKRPFPKWIFWLIAAAMALNAAALFPQTLSIPVIDFLVTSARLSGQEDIQTQKEAVVVVETTDGRGTGFSISDTGTILTNYHVIEGEDSVTVSFKEQGLFRAEVSETYPDIDLAVLETGETELPYLELAEAAAVHEDEPIHFIGNPLRFNRIANEGNVIGYTELSSWEKQVVMIKAPVYRGNSGSPVMDGQGKVIGIIFATLDHELHGKVGLMVPIDHYMESAAEN